MTTNKAKKPHKKSNFIWRIKTSASGDIRLVPIKNEVEKVLKGGTIYATVTSKILQNGKFDEAVQMIKVAGGTVSASRGRRMEIEVDGNNVESVGDVLDSLGCQWDLNN
jgi:translation initiation factor 1 (eIF-1/SUI1)